MTYVKICGVQSVAEALAARDAGADFIGIVFAESWRRVSVETARDIARALGPSRCPPTPPIAENGAAQLERLLVAKRPLLVGVFEGQTAAEIESVAERADIDVVQLHGKNPLADELTSRRPVIWAVDSQMGDSASGPGVLCMLDGSRGRGRLGDWESLAEIAWRMPFILAGGLTPKNVPEAVRRLRPWGVDVSSGVETAGRKDAAKIREFVLAAKGAIDMNLYPDENGRFGEFGGKYVPEVLMRPLAELEAAFCEAWVDDSFRARLDSLLREYAGRPTPLYFAEGLTRHCGGAQIYLKREDLLHTGAHKINNALAQGLLCQRMGKRRVIAETGAGQHGVAAATVCAMLGLECAVYMGEEDVRRQMLNVFRMRLLGAEVRVVESGSRTLKDAINEAMRDWVANAETTHYLLGSVVGPHPYPLIVREAQSVIGAETREQCFLQLGRLPDCLVACVGGGSNAMGFFHPFFGDASVRLIGVEAAGRGLESGLHCASLVLGRPGVLHGSRSYLLQDADGQIQPTHSISAGLDYPGVGPEHSFYKESKRAQYVTATDEEALAAFQLLSRTEGIIPALESAHAVAYAARLASTMTSDATIAVCVSGRGDKDMETASKELNMGADQSRLPF